MIINDRKFYVLLFLVCAFGGCKSFSRMIDKGGTMMTVEIRTDEPDRPDLVERAVKVTQNKLDAAGLDGEVAKVSENRMTVKLYGSNDLERIKKFLFTTYRLELKKVGGDFFRTFPSEQAAAPFVTEKHEILPFQEGVIESSPRQFIVVEKEAIVNGEDIRDAQAYSVSGDPGDYQINFTLRHEAAQRFGDWTGKNVGKYLAIVLDKVVISAPVIQGQIFDSGQITGRFTKGSAEEIAFSLKSGYLPATMKVVEEKTF